MSRDPYRPLKWIATIFLGLTAAAFINAYPWAITISAKVIGRDVACPWPQLLLTPLSTYQFQKLKERTRNLLSIERTDGDLGIELIRTPGRPFWIKKSGELMDGPTELAFVLAEQQWIAESAERYGVQPGDTVVDVGAHVGTFGDDALRRGAARVIMVEPDPVNVECIRRNFPREIAEGKVIVVPEGAWDKVATLPFSIGVANSGTGSLVYSEQGGSVVDVPVRPLDDILERIGIREVQFIKMDIQGAERAALRGAGRTLARSKPRIQLDMDHRPDDPVVLPQVIRTENAAYHAACTACAPDNSRIVPYEMFFY
jgi:FkbM family methyltransferase